MNLQNCNNMSDVLQYYATISPDNIFLHDGTEDKEYTYRQIDLLVNKTSNFLLEKGMNKGDIISAILSNSLEYFILFLSSIRLGVVYNPFPVSLSSRDLNRYINYVEPKQIFCEKKHFDYLSSQGLNVDLINSTGRSKSFLKNIDHFSDELVKNYIPQEKTLACLYYSSGTTGNPKGVLYSHKNIMALISSMVRCFGWTSNDCHLIVLPLGHTASINYSFLPCLFSGAKISFYESFWKIRRKFWDIIRDDGITYMEIVPTILYSILNTPYNNFNSNDIKILKYIGCGSATLALASQRELYNKFQIKVANLYGLSETGPTHYDNPLDNDWEPGSIGYPLDVNEVKIYDDDGKEVDVGVHGEIVIKGENVFIGYHKNMGGYNKVVKNGWFFTGDIGYKNKNGKYYFVDRKKDLIIKGGVNIYPGEIEEVIYVIDAVKEVITVGVPDIYLGEKIKSFIVLKDNKDLKESTLREHVLKELGNIKCPDDFIFIDKLPKGPSGKLLRRELKQSVNDNV